MKLAKNIIPNDQSLPSDMLFKLLEEYVKYKEQLQEKQQELKDIYNHRPYLNIQAPEFNNGSYILPFKCYKEHLFSCLQEIAEIEQIIEDTQKTISEFIPIKNQIYSITFNEENYKLGFIKLNPNTNNFFLLKSPSQK